jgi:hypothetical protein
MELLDEEDPKIQSNEHYQEIMKDLRRLKDLA